MDKMIMMTRQFFGFGLVMFGLMGATSAADAPATAPAARHPAPRQGLRCSARVSIG
jgi:hypothetical protein